MKKWLSLLIALMFTSSNLYAAVQPDKIASKNKASAAPAKSKTPATKISATTTPSKPKSKTRLSKKPIKPTPAKKIHLTAFDGIYARGNLQIKLISQAKQHILASKHSGLKEKVKNRILYLSAPHSINQHAASPIRLTIGMPDIKSLNISDNIHVTGAHITSHHLVLIAADNSSVNLSGMLNVRSITESGTSKINLQWINSPKLQVLCYDNAQIKLAGVTNILKARLFDFSLLKGRYLRANHIHIQTSGNAGANISALDSLRAFAYDWSNIYYYTQPQSLTRFTHHSGNVLHAG